MRRHTLSLFFAKEKCVMEGKALESLKRTISLSDKRDILLIKECMGPLFKEMAQFFYKYEHAREGKIREFTKEVFKDNTTIYELRKILKAGYSKAEYFPTFDLKRTLRIADYFGYKVTFYPRFVHKDELRIKNQIEKLNYIYNDFASRGYDSFRIFGEQLGWLVRKDSRTNLELGKAIENMSARSGSNYISIIKTKPDRINTNILSIIKLISKFGIYIVFKKKEVKEEDTYSKEELEAMDKEFIASLSNTGKIAQSISTKIPKEEKEKIVEELHGVVEPVEEKIEVPVKEEKQEQQITITNENSVIEPLKVEKSEDGKTIKVILNITINL